ncbi:PAS domain S-box protein (plasmid) [Roseomonas mucosa]|nr:PAS domain S-box protein [Roseomonas mucosa]
MIDDTSKLLGKRETVPGSGVQGHRKALEASAWLAAVVENSDDAIISKTLDGIITTWNRGAERLFGYTSHETIGQPIRMIIPDDRLFEEDEILRRLRNGERVDHFETVRLRKNGELVEISVTISPVRAEDGSILVPRRSPATSPTRSALRHSRPSSCGKCITASRISSP